MGPMQPSGDNVQYQTLNAIETGDNHAALALITPVRIPFESPSTPLESLRETADRATDFAAAAQAANTRRAYRADLEDFARWCGANELCVLPALPQTVVLYLTQLAERAKASTIRRRLVAINAAHRDREFPQPGSHPAVRTVLAGIVRSKGSAVAKKSALTIELLREALLTLDGSPRGTRDKALLLLGFAGGFRRSEIVALDIADLKFSRQGLLVALRRSKTDQSGQGRDIAIPAVPIPSLCPVKAVRAWLQVARIESGPLFRPIRAGTPTEARIEAKAIVRLVKRVVGAAGLEGDFAAHSLRAGFVTSAAERKIPDRDIQRVTGHKSATVLAGYVRRVRAFDDPALLTIMR